MIKWNYDFDHWFIQEHICSIQFYMLYNEIFIIRQACTSWGGVKQVAYIKWRTGCLYIGQRNESARADRRVTQKKTGVGTILKKIEEKHVF